MELLVAAAQSIMRSVNTQKLPRLTADMAFGIFAVLIAFAIRLWDLNVTSLWYDETFVLVHAREGILQAVAGLFREDNALPLHGLLLAVWIKLVGDYEFTARYLSVLLGTIGAPLVIRLAQAVGTGLKRTAGSAAGKSMSGPGDRRTPVRPSPTTKPAAGRSMSGLGAGLAYAALPILVYYSQEVRMYALAMPLAAGFTWAGWHLLAGRGRRKHGTEVAYVTLGLLMMMAHLFAGLAWVVMGIWGTLTLGLTGLPASPAPPRSWKLRLRHTSWWRANILLAILAIPIGIWALWRIQADATAVSAIPSEALRWIPILFGVGQYLTQPWATLFVIVSLGAILVSLIHTLRSGQTGSTLWLLISLTLPIAILFLMTSVKAKWSERYLLSSWGIASVVAIGIGWEHLLTCSLPRRLGPPHPSAALQRFIPGIVGLLLIASWSALAAPALTRQAEGTWAVALQDEWHPRPDFRGVTRYIEEHDTGEDAIVVVGGYAAVAIDYYYEGPAHLFGIPLGARILDTQNIADLQVLESLQQEAGTRERIWLVLWQDRLADPTNLVQSILVEACHRLPVDAGFTNVGLLLFDIGGCRPLDQLATPVFPLDIPFQAPIHLKGYDLIRQNNMWEVDLWWQTTGTIDEDYVVFVHLVAPDGTMITQHDHIAGDDAYPTSQWRVGTRLRDRFFLEVVDGTCQDCELRIGLYTGERRLLTADGIDAVTLLLPPREADSARH